MGLALFVRTPSPFSFTELRLYGFSPDPSGYGDKLRRAIGTADPGAVPGGSTTFPSSEGNMTGPN